VRAVGAAVGRNPVSVIVPCHRVIGSGGSLTGYAGGLQRKRALLDLEGAVLDRCHSSPASTSSYRRIPIAQEKTGSKEAGNERPGYILESG
jgi:alkylated DNA nucleotide flippase Atl1